MSCFLVEMPADAVVPASRRDETKTRKSSMSLMGSIWFRRNLYIPEFGLFYKKWKVCGMLPIVKIFLEIF